MSNVATLEALKAEVGDYGNIKGGAVAEDDFQRLQTLNEQYSLVLVGGKLVVIAENPDSENGSGWTFIQVQGFKTMLAPERGIDKFSLADAWLSWSKRRYFQGIGFWPEREPPRGCFNLYRGFSVKPTTGNVAPFLDLIRHICSTSGDGVADCFLNWLAHIFQRPWEKPTYSVLIFGQQAGGKGSIYRALQGILGRLCIQVNGASEITSRFNAVLLERLLVFCDEADLSKRETTNRLKAVISEKTISIEKKGLDREAIQNCARMMFACNSQEMPLYAEDSERRYLVIETPKSNLTPEFFTHFNLWLEHGGASHLLEYFLQRDIAEFSPYRPRTTNPLREAKLNSIEAGGVKDWICSELQKTNPFQQGNGHSDPAKIAVQDVISRFQLFRVDKGLKQAGEKQAGSRVGKALAALGVTTEGRAGRGDGKQYIFPSSDSMREALAASMGLTVDELF